MSALHFSVSMLQDLMFQYLLNQSAPSKHLDYCRIEMRYEYFLFLSRNEKPVISTSIPIDSKAELASSLVYGYRKNAMLSVPFCLALLNQCLAKGYVQVHSP